MREKNRAASWNYKDSLTASPFDIALFDFAVYMGKPASPGSSKTDQLSHEVRGFGSVSIVSEGLQLTRVARQGLGPANGVA